MFVSAIKNTHSNNIAFGRLSEHSQAVLEITGYSEDEIFLLKASRIDFKPYPGKNKILAYPEKPQVLNKKAALILATLTAGVSLSEDKINKLKEVIANSEYAKMPRQMNYECPCEDYPEYI